MLNFIVRRLLYTVVVIIVVSFLSFAIIHLTPGDPAVAMLGPNATPEQIQALRHDLWLDRPLYTQYIHWAGNVLHGDLGFSITRSEATSKVISRTLPVTLYLSSIALVFSAIIGIFIGIISAIRRATFLDNILVLFATMGLATPVFWLAIMCIWLFAFTLNWLPIQGFIWPSENLGKSLASTVLPVICLSLSSVAILARQTRSSMLEVIRQDYIRTAKAKGLTERTITVKHALKNAMIPVVTLLGINVRVLISGSVLTETVFNIPGMGRLIVDAAQSKDFLVIQACILIISVVTCLANLIVDISYGWLDPRTRFG